ncbi:MAG: ABC transporter permease [Phycisphaerales bacterium]|nr:ABC transporter permease [Phycisphaerales bacterium]
MSQASRHSPDPSAPRSLAGRTLQGIGTPVLELLTHIGDMVGLLLDTLGVVLKAVGKERVRLGWSAAVSQIIRVGLRSIGIVSLVSGCIGFILAFQLSPPLDEFGQKELVANIVSVAVLRELGPLIAAIVLTGFAGASIAAEIGTMVVSEEVEALEAMALSPVRFLVVPRVIASVLAMLVLAVLADIVAIGMSATVAITILDIPWATYKQNTLDQAKLVDFLTGVGKGGVFGLLIGLIACGNGLKVLGGAAGVGKATTGTVVQSVVAVILADLVFTAIFYALKLV